MKLNIPAVRGVMDRRILINYRVDPVVLGRLIPAPFRVKRVHCWGVAGICLIRLRQSRPKGLPARLGFSSENAAYRFAVEWEENGAARSGVYIPIRHTNFWLNALAGGRLFPGPHALSKFDVCETKDLLKLELRTRAADQDLKLICRKTNRWPADSVFANETEASEFFRNDGVGYSPTPRPNRYEGVELHPDEWRTDPLSVEHLDSRYFENPKLFPAGSIHFDSALLMRNIGHEWRSLPTLVHSPTTTERLAPRRAPGVADVWMSRPHRLVNEPSARPEPKHRHAAFLELP